jgi:poly(3-hydroxybutyrate) depolymerase
MLRPSILAALVLALTAAARVDTPPSDPYAPLRATLEAASKELGSHFLDVQKRYGSAADLQSRLDADLGSLISPSTPPSWTDAEYVDANVRVASLDRSLVDQLSTGTYRELAAVRGLDDVLIKSPADGTMQPVALYVPPAYDGSKPFPLVVFLHGRGSSEADALGVPWIRALADETGAIVAAPYARGDIQYADPAPADIYAAVDAVERAFAIDRHRVFLAGHSMGGFGVFEVGPAHPEIWAALLCISGSLTTQDRDDVVRKLRSKTIYVVSGVNDDTIPFRYSQLTVQWLRSSGVATRFYAENGGGHSMATFRPSLRAAWHDMLAGVTADSGSVAPGSAGQLPQMPPVLPFKP